MEAIFKSRFTKIVKNENYAVYFLKNNIFYIKFTEDMPVEEIMEGRKYKKIERGKNFFIGLLLK